MNGGQGGDRLIGGSSRDFIDGGPGTNRIFGGSGNDVIDSANLDGREFVDCGSGRRDIVVADRGDRLRNCERVRRSR
jgi:Ca2+-binding RTX toxin-like protein